MEKIIFVNKVYYISRDKMEQNHKMKTEGWGLGHDMEEIAFIGEPICVSTLSSHCKGPLRCSSIQQGVEVTSCR